MIQGHQLSYSQYICPCNRKNHSTNSHGIDLFLHEFTGFSTRRFKRAPGINQDANGSCNSVLYQSQSTSRYTSVSIRSLHHKVTPQRPLFKDMTMHVFQAWQHSFVVSCLWFAPVCRTQKTSVLWSLVGGICFKGYPFETGISVCLFIILI